MPSLKWSEFPCELKVFNQMPPELGRFFFFLSLQECDRKFSSEKKDGSFQMDSENLKRYHDYIVIKHLITSLN